MKSSNSSTVRPDAAGAADVIVIGDGVIGMSTAYELARAGATVCLLGSSRPGAASGAAAGLLAPSVGTLPLPAKMFFEDSLKRYPDFLARLRSYDAGLDIIRGLIEIPSAGVAAASAPAGCRALSPGALAQLEPEADVSRGGWLFPDDGAIDNVRLVAALRSALADEPRIRRADAGVEIDPAAGRVRIAGGTWLEAGSVVLAAGAWSPSIAGLPRELPVHPLKGQMLAVASNSLRHPLMGDDVYLVPRGGEIVIGATAERDGFDVETRDEAIADLRRRAVSLMPGLRNSRVTRRWAGIRPATPDMLPIIGRDPDHRRLIYACGHSKNGILLAPATAAAVVRVVQNLPETASLSPFSINRFARA